MSREIIPTLLDETPNLMIQNSPLPNPFESSKFQSSEGGLNQSKDNKEFFQQLLNWQENPSQ